jgi:hypothetical protein
LDSSHAPLTDARAVAKTNALATMKNVGLLAAAPFIGLAYAVALPFVGIALIGKTGCRPGDHVPPALSTSWANRIRL